MGNGGENELPLAIVKRVVKAKLADLANDKGDPSKKDFSIQKDALLALSESAKIFIHYLSATANDICKESKRQNVNVEDVLKALEDTEFTEFVEPLQVSLGAFRKQNASKKSEMKEKSGGGKRKAEAGMEMKDGNEKQAEDLNGMDDEFGEENPVEEGNLNLE
eukprot:Gb_13217 [translate_table: standard]